MNGNAIAKEKGIATNIEVVLVTPNATERGDPSETGTETICLGMGAMAAAGGGAMAEEHLGVLSKPEIGPWLNAWESRSWPTLACAFSIHLSFISLLQILTRLILYKHMHTQILDHGPVTLSCELCINCTSVRYFSLP